MPKEANAGFYARFLGGFVLEFGGKRISITRSMKQKSMQILAILLKSGQEGISRKSLIEMLEWEGDGRERDSWERKLNNLRRQTCKLRKMIKEAGFPEGNYIQVSKGRYYFSLDFKVETDIEKIDRLYRKARSQADEKEQEITLWEICDTYQGEFLPELVAEEWALVENAHYRSIYSRCVNELCRMLKGRGDYTRLLQLCTTASQIHPYDEWQAVQIDCLLVDNRYQDACRVRRQANELFSRELGITPFQNEEEKMYARGKRPEPDDKVMAGIMSGLLEKEAPQGAYRCNYPQFMDVYRFMVRMSERGQVKLKLLLCTLKPGGEYPEGGEKLADVWMPEECEVPGEQAERFGKLLAESVRDNDVYTRYSQNQYLVLLSSFGESREIEVTERLRRGWKTFEEEEGIKVELEIQALGAQSGKEAI